MRELESRRSAEADRHRTEASEREQRADRAEQEARVAQQKAERERADARIHEERATMHERGMADDELIGDDERDRFAGVAGTGADTDRDDRSTATGRTTADDETMRSGVTDDERPGATAAGARDDDTTMRSGVDEDKREAYQEGRADESRFQREARREDQIER